MGAAMILKDLPDAKYPIAPKKPKPYHIILDIVLFLSLVISIYTGHLHSISSNVKIDGIVFLTMVTGMLVTSFIPTRLPWYITRLWFYSIVLILVTVMVKHDNNTGMLTLFIIGISYIISSQQDKVFLSFDDGDDVVEPFIVTEESEEITTVGILVFCVYACISYLLVLGFNSNVKILLTTILLFVIYSIPFAKVNTRSKLHFQDIRTMYYSLVAIPMGYSIYVLIF